MSIFVYMYLQAGFYRINELECMSTGLGTRRPDL